jgi:hypothetical protein
MYLILKIGIAHVQALECHKIKTHSKMNMLHQKSPKQNQA